MYLHDDASFAVHRKTAWFYFYTQQHHQADVVISRKCFSFVIPFVAFNFKPRSSYCFFFLFFSFLNYCL